MKILLNPVVFSILAGLLLVAIPNKFRKLIESFSLLSAVYIFVSSIKIFFTSPISTDLLYLDDLSKLMVLGIGFFGALITFYSLGFMQNYDRFKLCYVNIIWIIGFSILTVLSNNIVLLAISWIFIGLCLVILIGSKDPEQKKSSKKVFYILGLSSILMVLGFVILYFLNNTLVLSSMILPINSLLSFLAFILVSVGAFTRLGIMPFHSWIPEMSNKVPMPINAILPASLDRILGMYLLSRIVLNVFKLNMFTNDLLMVLGAVTILLAVIAALFQHDFRRLLGYDGISQAGYMILGFGTGTIIGIAGALFHMLNNTLYMTSLYLTGGNVQKKTNSADLDSLGGLSNLMPVTFFASLIAALSVSGVPPFNGFMSKWMIYQAIVERGRSGGFLWVFCLVAAMVGSSLTLASFLKFIHALFLGRAKDTAKVHKKGSPLSMKTGPVVLSALCIIFGIFGYVIPLKYLILPALKGNVGFIGIWLSIQISIFLLVGLGIGLLIYRTGNIKNTRETTAYIGGEKLEGNMRLSGTEFYLTLKEMPFINRIYKMTEGKRS